MAIPAKVHCVGTEATGKQKAGCGRQSVFYHTTDMNESHGHELEKGWLRNVTQSGEMVGYHAYHA